MKEKKDGLHVELKMKDLGEAKLLLGMEIRKREIGDVFLVSRAICSRCDRTFGKGGVQI